MKIEFLYQRFNFFRSVDLLIGEKEKLSFLLFCCLWFPTELLFTFGPLFSQEVEYETCVDWKKCDFLSQVFVLLSSSRRGAVVSVFLRSCYAFSFLYLLKDETQWIWNTVFFIVIWTFPKSLNLLSFLLNFSWVTSHFVKKKDETFWNGKQSLEIRLWHVLIYDVNILDYIRWNT